MPSFLENVSSNRLTDRTIKRMFELVGSAVTDPKFQELVYNIVGGLPGKDYQGELRAILNWVKQNIRYTKDPYGVELVQDPWTTINRNRGDCDDMSILISAMGEVLGNPSHFVTVSVRPDKEPCHVYSELNVKGRWLAMDATVPGSSVGWKPSGNITDRRIWTRQDVGVSGYEDAVVEGFGMLNQWRQTVRPIKLTREPDDISHTYADMTAGTPFVSQRSQPGSPRAMVARYSDITEQTAPGGTRYDGHYPIVPQKTYKDAWSFIPRESVPIQLHAFGRMDPWKADWTKILPTPNVPEDRFMLNAVDSYAVGMAGLGDISESEADAVVNAAVHDTAAKVAAGVIQKHQAEDHAKAVIQAVKTGDVSAVKQNPITAKTVVSIARRRGKMGGGGIFADPSLNWLPTRGGIGGLGEYYRKGATLGGLSDDNAEAIVNAAQADITRAVQSGAIPAAAAPAAAAKVIDAVGSGDSSVVNPKNTPHTHALMRKIRGGGGGGSGTAVTPATKPHHPVTGSTVRRGYSEMRAQSQDYWDADPSLEWNPRLYGMGQVRKGKVDLRKVVNSLVRQRLPAMAHRAGVHPHRLAQVMGTRARGVSGLGQTTQVTVDPATVSAVSNATTNALTGVVDPSNAAQVSGGVTAALNAILGTAGGQTSGFSFSLGGWGVPLLVMTAVGAAGYFMISRARKAKYKSNPRRGGGKKGGGSMKLVLIGGAALAALMIIKKPAAAAQPQTLAQKLMSSVSNLFSTPQGQAQVSSAVTGISKLFASGPSTPAPAAAPSSTAAPAPAGAPTDPFAANAQAQAAIDAATSPAPDTSSNIVTSIDTSSSD